MSHGFTSKKSFVCPLGNMEMAKYKGMKGGSRILHTTSLSSFKCLSQCGIWQKKKKVFACVDTSLAIHADHTDVHSSAGHLLYSEKSFLANEFDVVSSLAITWRELFWLHDGWPMPSVQSLEVSTAVAGESRGSGWRQESAGTDAWGQDPEKRAGTC